jgi:bifunctional non-homologous end joining protein LigD
VPRDARSPGGEHPTLLDVRDARAGVPRVLAPMRARQAAWAFNSSEFVFELKWDGLRAIASRADDVVRIVDRNGGDLLPLLPELAQLPVPDGTMLDGEVVVCDSRGRPSYDLLAGRLGPNAARRGFGPTFVAFDLLYHEGRPLLTRPLAERRRRLAALGLRARTIGVPTHLDTDGEPFLDVVAEYGLEGIIAKRKQSAYLPAVRSADWLKCHVTPRADVIVGGVVLDERRGARTVLCGLRADDGSIAYAGDAYVPPYLGTWLDGATRDFAAQSSPFATPVALRGELRFLRPRLIAVVEYAEMTPSGELRDARFRTLRLDGRADDARREESVSVPSYPPHTNPDRPRLVVLHSLPFGMSKP